MTKSTTIIVILTTVIICCIFSFCVLAFSSQLPASFWLSLLDPKQNFLTNSILPQLIQDGDYVSLKEVWAYQASLYQVIITFLIGLNGIVAVVAFIYVDKKSEAAAENHTRKYLDSVEFRNIWEAKYQEFSPDLEQYVTKIESSVHTIEVLQLEMQEVRRQLEIISRVIAERDFSEDSEVLNLSTYLKMRD